MRQLAHLADIERRLLAPLQALLGDAHAVLGTELDSVRLEEAASAISFALPVATPSAPLATKIDAQRVARAPAAEVSYAVKQGGVASPRALAWGAEQGVFAPVANGHEVVVQSPLANNASAPTRLADRRVDAFSSVEAGTAPTPHAGSSPMAPGNDLAPYPMAPNSMFPLSAQHTTSDKPSETDPFAGPRTISTNSPSTTSARPPLTASGAGTEFGTLPAEQGASPSGANDPAATTASTAPAGNASAPTRLADRRVDAFSSVEAGTAPTPHAGSFPVAPGNDRAPYPMPPNSMYPLSAPHTASDEPSETDPLAGPRAISTNSPSTTSPPPPLTASGAGTDFPTLRTTVHSGPNSRIADSAPLCRSPATDGQTEHLSIPPAAPLHGSDPAPGTPLPEAAFAALSAYGDQTRHVDTSASTSTSATAQPPATSPLTAAKPSHRLAGIPLRPRQILPPETSFPTPHLGNPAPPGKDAQAAARRFAAAVEPSLEQAYRLSQARLDTARLATTEAESSSLVRNTFNVTVTLAADNPDTALDPATLEDALTDVLRAAARRHGLEL